MAKPSTCKMTITVLEIQSEVQSTNNINIPKKLFEMGEAVIVARLII